MTCWVLTPIGELQFQQALLRLSIINQSLNAYQHWTAGDRPVVFDPHPLTATPCISVLSSAQTPAVPAVHIAGATAHRPSARWLARRLSRILLPPSPTENNPPAHATAKENIFDHLHQPVLTRAPDNTDYRPKASSNINRLQRINTVGDLTLNDRKMKLCVSNFRYTSS